MQRARSFVKQGRISADNSLFTGSGIHVHKKRQGIEAFPARLSFMATQCSSNAGNVIREQICISIRNFRNSRSRILA
ncbi:hypothetical protein Shel_08400 [Slackia heliotrinireducens DSM 20476]|uniref:Uncharacterized protein n=1 Tax=Slackia heliotrinireducens (strain ATCC 29202 / DSM 20476 / NCTC 11029 / RHS 1) TaxID=471855 RepID=C7N4Q7_SLAHD|nr:hypothetical protein Shel_08400 [Slackia heliotrinireducens DSM 20476]